MIRYNHPFIRKLLLPATPPDSYIIEYGNSHVKKIYLVLDPNIHGKAHSDVKVYFKQFKPNKRSWVYL